MPKLKLTKTELKNQRDDLQRFRRFLPTLELKKEQLIVEIRRIETVFDEKMHAEEILRDDVESWVELFSEPVEIEDKIKLTSIETGQGNIAGVTIPVFIKATFEKNNYDLFEVPLWVDRGVVVVEELATLQVERRILDEQKGLLHRELQVTIQRINLFDKVKIPECRENIRKIQIYLGDQQANAVARGKIAKSKIAEPAIIANKR